MKSTICRFFNLFLVLVGITCSFAVQADYMFTSIEPDDATLTQVWDINNSGKVIGNADIDGSPSRINFLYDPKKKVITPLASPLENIPVLIGINESGVIVGQTGQYGLILSKKNTVMPFSLDGYDVVQARGIGPSGLVTGYAIKNDQAGSIGFIYDPDSNTYVEILPNSDPVVDIDILAARFTIAKGINGRGQVVGNATLNAEDAASFGCPEAGTYGFLRAVNGDITLFRVNGQNTWARGINDSGLITGFVEVGDGFTGFVGSLSAESGCQSLDDPVLLEVSGIKEIFPQAINNSGVIVGEWVREKDGKQQGFVAMPLPPGKNNK